MRPLPFALLAAGLLHAQEPAVTFDRYHTTAATAAALEGLAAAHPDRLRLEVLGRSTAGREILLAVVTDFRGGPAAEKPAVYVGGNIHGNERVGGEAALRLVARLVQADPGTPAAALLRRVTFYVVPKTNPDGADLWVRGIPAPQDDDGDGRADEDGPDDVDGNGRITYMRVTDPEGEFIPDGRNELMVPLARLSVRERRRYRGPRYRVLLEGRDDDGDGRVNEDGPDFDLDPNRDFPADLRLERRYRKQYARTGTTRQRRSDTPFLRSAEARAVAAFLRRHPEIALVVSFHSFGNALFRPFGYLPDRPIIPRPDLARFNFLADLFRRTTGARTYGPPYLGRRQVVGTLHDFAYWELGIPALTVEIWSVPGLEPDWTERGGRRARGRRSRTYLRARRLLEFLRAEGIPDGFFPWKPYDHPTLGRVEIGGLWHIDRFRYNPPPSRLRATIDPFVDFVLETAALLPRLEIRDVRVKPLREGVYALEVEVANAGRLPTAWALAVKRRRARGVTVRLALLPPARMDVGRPQRSVGFLAAGASRRVRFAVAVANAAPVRLTVTAAGGPAGTARRTVVLGGEGPR